MIFRQLFDPVSSTYTYLLGCPSEHLAAVLDPVDAGVDACCEVLDELGLRLLYAFETHVHADHVTGSGALRARLGARVALHRSARVDCADLLLDDGNVVDVGTLRIEILAVPGHTSGDIAFRVQDRVLTGDSLLIGGCGRTDFQDGDAGRLYDSVHARLFSLPPDTRVFPCHDYKGRTETTIGVERASNPRLTRSRAEFIRLMGELGLPPPRAIDRALSLNLRCGIAK